MADKLDVIKVKSGLDSNRVALSERHSDHPNGEVLIYGDETFEAAKTPAVLARLSSGVLVEVKATVKRTAKKKEAKSE